MIGVFDSGDGGLAALREIRKIIPCADIVFLADRKNAPYGTKTKAELIRLVTNDIERLREAGADTVLMACCTASTVYRRLPHHLQEISVPIILPAVREAAAVTECGRIGVIATEHTVRERAFTRELSRFKNVKEAIELPLQMLVGAVESGIGDGHITDAQGALIYRMLRPLKDEGIDTLILGCTHFSHLEREIGKCLPNVRIVSPAREGAREITKHLPPKGKGRTIYME